MAFSRHGFTLAACEKCLSSPHVPFTVYKGGLLDGKRVQSITHKQIPTLCSGFMTKVNLSHAAALYSLDVLQVDFYLTNDRLLLGHKDV